MDKQERKAIAASTAAATAASTAAATAAALVGLDIGYIKRDIAEIKESIAGLRLKEESYVRKEDFVFWRNLLISGMLLAIFLGTIKMFLK